MGQSQSNKEICVQDIINLLEEMNYSGNIKTKYQNEIIGCKKLMHQTLKNYNIIKWVAKRSDSTLLCVGFNTFSLLEATAGSYNDDNTPIISKQSVYIVISANAFQDYTCVKKMFRKIREKSRKEELKVYLQSSEKSLEYEVKRLAPPAVVDKSKKIDGLLNDKSVVDPPPSYVDSVPCAPEK